MTGVVFLAAGGTGGHVFPAVAVAEQLGQRGFRPLLITDRRGAKIITALPEAIKSRTIAAGSPFGDTRLKRIKGLAQLAWGSVQTLMLMFWYRPKAVMGFGGYPAVAPVLMAAILGCPSILHEQNAFFGRANRFLARHVRAIGLSWQNTRNIPPTAQHKVFMAGMPVREAFRHVAEYTPPHGDEAIRILIIGGSLGAHVFGETVPEAMSRLPAPLRGRLKITQQARPEQIESIRRRYDDAGVEARLHPFITDMPEQFARAHLIISRAGASSIAEMAASGRPAVLVPYPDAMDDHQTANAESVAEAGGGWCIPESEMSAGSLAGRIAALVSTPEDLAQAAMQMHRLDSGPAATILADHTIGLMQGGAST